jgi:hypothetical protein
VLRERRDSEEERRQQTDGFGTVVEEKPPLFLPTPCFRASMEEE